MNKVNKEPADQTKTILLAIWLYSAATISLPGMSYCLWQNEILTSGDVTRYAGTTLLLYFTGNIAALIFVAIAIWKLNLAKSTTSNFFSLHGLLLIVLIAIVGYFGMGQYITEFIVG